MSIAKGTIPDMPCSECLKLSLMINLADNLYIIMAIKLANDVAYSTAFEPEPDCKAENQPALLSPVIIRKNGINITIEPIGTIMYLADGFSPGFIGTSAVSLLIMGTAFFAIGTRAIQQSSFLRYLFQKV